MQSKFKKILRNFGWTRYDGTPDEKEIMADIIVIETIMIIVLLVF